MDIDTHIICYERPNKSKKKCKKVFVFDFDETLGSFSHLYYLWTLIGSPKETSLFHSFADLYPEFLRYGILVILEFVYYKKKKGHCDQIFIYTNNQCPVEWVNLIVSYIHYKLPLVNELPLFDRIIYAFKINDKIVEMERTTGHKTYSDFIRCSVISKNTEICFIDDTYHSKMIHNKIYYIQPRPYYHSLSKKVILNRLFSSNLFSELNIEQIKRGFSPIQDFYKTETDKHIDIMVSKKLMYYIKEFFYSFSSSTKTHKKNSHIGKFTRKNKINGSMNHLRLQ